MGSLLSEVWLNKIFFFLAAFIYLDAAIDHTHEEIMSPGLDACRWARTLIRKSIVLSICLVVFGEGLRCEDSVRSEWEATYSAISQQYHGLCWKQTITAVLCCLLSFSYYTHSPGLLYESDWDHVNHFGLNRVGWCWHICGGELLIGKVNSKLKTVAL